MSKAQDALDKARNFTYGKGNDLSDQAQSDAAYQKTIAGNYKEYGDQAYDPLIGGQGGYTPEQQAAILQEQQLRGLPTSQDQLQANFRTPEEQAAVTGDPNSFAKYFAPDDTTNIANEGAANQRGAVETEANNTRDAAGNLRRDLYAPTDNPNLQESKGFVDATGKAVTGTAAGVHGAVDLARLRQDPAYAQRVRMTQQQQQDIVTGAGITAGTGYRAAAGDLDRQAAAAGMDPAAAAAEKESLLRQGAGAASDAETQARIGASNAAAAREANIEAGRRAGETSAADIGSSTELALGNQQLTAAQRLEATRLAAEQHVADMKQAAGSESGQAALANERSLGVQNVANETQMERERQDANLANQHLGTSIATSQDQATVDRARDNANNRQTTQVGNENTQFGQGKTVNDTLSARNTAIANESQNQAKEGRSWLYNNEVLGSNNANAASNRQAGLYGTEAGSANTGTGQQISQSSQPALWQKLVGAGTGIISAVTGGGGYNPGSGIAQPSTTTLPSPSSNGGYYGSTTPTPGYATVKPQEGAAKGRVVTKPTSLVVGEQGPEAVIPLSHDQGDSYGRPRPVSGIAPPQRRQGPRFLYGHAA